jgi:disulfide bond formation protein DsbB
MIRLPPSLPVVFLALLLTCAGLLGYGYFLQYARGLEPCPLCIFQRLAYLAVATGALIGLLWRGAAGARTALGAVILFSAVGGAVAGRQVWLQHLPADRVPECGPGLDFILEAFPLSEALQMVFAGSGECARVDWTFLSLSIAEWSLLWFLLFPALASWCLLRHPAMRGAAA